MLNSINTWLACCPDPTSDPIQGMREAGLLDPAPDYATIARLKAALVERTGLLEIASVWGGRQLVYRHFLSFGTEAQRLEWARRALSVAISEPKVGAHPKLLTTVPNRSRAASASAARKPGSPTARQPTRSSSSPSPPRTTAASATAPSSCPGKRAGLTTTDMPGFHALRPSRHCLLTLDGCFVPESAMLGPSGSAYERMALPFRDIEDAVGTFGTLGALRHALSLFAGAALEQTEDLGAIVALVAVFAAGAEAVVGSLDDGRLHTGNATLVGLRVLAADIVARLRSLAEQRAYCEHPRRPRRHPVDRARPPPGAAGPTGSGRDPRRAQPMTTRCHWAETADAVMQAYHDTEWGVPHHDDAALFELLTLEGAQAGLSWRTVLVRRDAYRKAYHGFDIERVAAMSDADLEALLADSPLIRNRLKIFSTRDNARAALSAIAQHGSLDRYLWSFVNQTPIRNKWTERSQVPATTPVSDAMSKALKKAGFRFVGSTICYAFMQATGMVDDHMVDCFRHTQE